MKTKINWNDKEELKAYKKEYNSRPEVKKHNKKIRKKYHSRPEVKKHNKKIRKKYHSRPEVKKHNKKIRKKYHSRPEVKKRKKEHELKRNKEIIKKRHKEYYLKNRENCIKYAKEYYQDNKEERKEWDKKYREETKIEENKRRKKLGLSLIGEGFRKEMELLVYVHSLFQNYEIFTHHRKLLGDWGKQGLELDIYIPELKLAFEYNGEQHYVFTDFFHTEEDFEAQKYRDRCKKRICKLKGITLIRIKYDEKLSEQLVLSKLKYVSSLISVQRRI